MITASPASRDPIVPAATVHEVALARRLKSVPDAGAPSGAPREGPAGHPRASEPLPAAQPAAATRPDSKAAERLLDTMRIVKSARFNAATRLERKQAVSLFTQSMLALYFIGLAVWQAVYFGEIDDASMKLLTFLSIVSSVFTLMLGLLEAMNDYQMKAHHLHNCALAVSELAQEMDIERPTDAVVVQAYRRRYNETLKTCSVNHSYLDYEMAKRGRGSLPWWLLLRARYALDVYGLYAVFLLVPPLLWVVHQ